MALEMIEHALARNPSNAHALAVGAVVNAWVGRSDKAIGLAERALRCSPFDPIRHLAFAATARAKLLQGDAEAALVAARAAVHANPGHLPSHGYVLICLVRLCRPQELAMAIERMRASFPGVRASHFSAHTTFEPFNAELAAHMRAPHWTATQAGVWGPYPTAPMLRLTRYASLSPPPSKSRSTFQARRATVEAVRSDLPTITISYSRRGSVSISGAPGPRDET